MQQLVDKAWLGLVWLQALTVPSILGAVVLNLKQHCLSPAKLQCPREFATCAIINDLDSESHRKDRALPYNCIDLCQLTPDIIILLSLFLKQKAMVSNLNTQKQRTIFLKQYCSFTT